MCTYDRAALVQSAVRSLGAQTLPTEQYEIVVVDNASRDDTADILRTLARDIRNLRCLLEPRPGLSRARNRAVQQARGRLLAFLDDDALASPCWLEALLDAYGSGDDVVAVGGRTFLEWPVARPGWLPSERDRFYGSFDLGEERQVLRFPTYPFGANMAIERDALLAVGGFPLHLGRKGGSLVSNEEKFVFRRLSEAGGTVLYAPDAVVRHVVLADRVKVGWVLRRSFAQGRSNVIDRALSEPCPSRRLWLGGVSRDLWQAAIQSARLVGPTPQAVVRAASRVSHRLGAGWEGALFSLRPPVSLGSEEYGQAVPATPRPLRVAGQASKGNPYTSLLYESVAGACATAEELTIGRLLVSRYDIVHLHWPEFWLRARSRLRATARSLALLSALAVARRRGARVVWTVHNLVPHEECDALLSRLFWTAVVSLVDGVTSLTKGGVEPIRARIPRLRGKPVFVIPHGHYRGHYRDVVTRDEARDELGLASADRVVLFFGRIRPYKNVMSLLRAFGGLEDPAARLLVAGRVWSEALQREVVMAAADDDQVHLHLQFVPPDRVQLFFRAADLVVLPFSRVFNSGSAVLALSFDRPILVPALPVFEELQADLGDAWVRTYRGQLDAATLEWALSTGPPPGHPPLEGLAWPKIGRDTVAAYRALLESAPAGVARISPGRIPRRGGSSPRGSVAARRRGGPGA